MRLKACWSHMDLPKNFCASGFFSNFCESKPFHGVEAEMVCYRDPKCIPCSLFTRSQSKLFLIWLTLAQLVLVPVPAPTVIWVGAVLGSGLAPCSARCALQSCAASCQGALRGTLGINFFHKTMNDPTCTSKVRVQQRSVHQKTLCPPSVVSK